MSVRVLLGATLVVTLIAAWLLVWQWDALLGRLCPECPPVDPTASVTQSERSASVGEDRPVAPIPQEAAVRQWIAGVGTSPVWPDNLLEPQSCEDADAEMERLCAAVELRPGTEVRGLCETLREASRALARRPPSPAAELRSYGTMLGNVFHLYRVLGQDRVDSLRELLESEAELAEPLAMAQFRWMLSRERCADAADADDEPVRIEALYEYAAFAFQTMGGQAYLRRRTPQVEALTAFYALLIVDRAQSRAHNPHGIDARPEIARTRAMIESRPLVFRERYLEVLDTMERNWPPR